MSTIKSIADNDFYIIKHNETSNILKLLWKKDTDVDINTLKEGINDYSNNCLAIKPVRAIIDATRLAPTSDPVLWVSSQKEFDDYEAYIPWWMREIAPTFNASGIKSLGTATGNPNALGEFPQTPPGVNFKMGLFTTFEQVLAWE